MAREPQPVRPPLASEPTARSLAAPVVVRSVAGTRTRVYQLDNHFAWLSVCLHLMSRCPQKSRHSLWLDTCLGW